MQSPHGRFGLEPGFECAPEHRPLKTFCLALRASPRPDLLRAQPVRSSRHVRGSPARLVAVGAPPKSSLFSGGNHRNDLERVGYNAASMILQEGFPSAAQHGVALEDIQRITLLAGYKGTDDARLALALGDIKANNTLVSCTYGAMQGLAFEAKAWVRRGGFKTSHDYLAAGDSEAAKQAAKFWAVLTVRCPFTPLMPLRP